MIIVRYGEIGLKGKNRFLFVNKLVGNIKKHLAREGYSSTIVVYHGRIFVYTSADAKLLKNVLGIVSVSNAIETDLSIDSIYKVVKNLVKAYTPKTFKISTQRLWKKYQYTSVKVNELIGSMVLRDFTTKVDLTTPELNIQIEIIKNKAYIFTEKIRGFGGLPVGIEGTAIALISGGIDSPVAAWLVMKRGVKIILLHFYHSDEQRARVEKVIRVLQRYAPDPIEVVYEEHGQVMNKFIHHLYYLKKSRWTCVFCRYFMWKRAEELAREKGALAIVTGESLGQVASQTLANIHVESSGVSIPIFRPLIGLNKLDIEQYAKLIGTYEKSIFVKGCGCPYLPQYPVTNASMSQFNTLKNQVLSHTTVPEIDINKLTKNSC